MNQASKHLTTKKKSTLIDLIYALLFVFILPKNKGPSTSAVVDIVVITTCKAGPAVSLNGSPAVSPVTAALCASDPF